MTVLEGGIKARCCKTTPHCGQLFPPAPDLSGEMEATHDITEEVDRIEPGIRQRGLVWGVALTTFLTALFVLFPLIGTDRTSAQGPTGQLPGFEGSRDYIVLFDKGVELGPRLRNEIAKGNEVEARYATSINGALIQLEAEDVVRLRGDDRVLTIEPDRPVSISGWRSTERSGGQIPWGLDRINQRNLPLDGSISNSVSGAGVTAYVIDTGIKTDHSEFAGRINSEGFSAYGSSTDDCEGHGTHVAGTIAGSSYGVAPAARLTAVRVLDCDGRGSGSDVLAGINWMIRDHLGAPPAGTRNDRFADRETLSSLSGVTGSNVGASAESGEPSHYRSVGPWRSVWWRWTASANGTLVLDTSGSSFDTVLAAYTGTSLGSLIQRASDDDSGSGVTSRVSLPVTAGTTYSVAVDGYSSSSTGEVNLSGSFTPGPGGNPGPGDPGSPPAPVAPDGPAVANMSLGGLRSETENIAIQRAVDAGITMVVAAGNDSANACDYSPASAPAAITVGSVGITDSRSGFSNTGACVDLFAPGEEVISAGIGSPSDSLSASGTSMAAPHVAGAAARLLGRTPSMTPAAVTNGLTVAATTGVITQLNSTTVNRLLFVPGSTPRVSAPSGDIVTTTDLNSASLFLSASREGRYECSLDGAGWQPCQPGALRYSNLGLGTHEFRVRGSVDGEVIPEIVQTWRYVPAAPTITRGPAKPGTSRKALFRFRTITGLSAECKLDRGPWRACRSPKRYSGLKTGRHTFRVRQLFGELVSPESHWTWKVRARTLRGGPR